jgi:hypothetical protein
VHAGVDAREPHDAAAARNGTRSCGMTSPTATANAAADAEWPRERMSTPASAPTLRGTRAPRGRAGAGRRPASSAG